MSVHAKSMFAQSIAAVCDGIIRPREWMRLGKSFARLPVEYRASRAWAKIPAVDFAACFPEFEGEIRSGASQLRRHGWNVKLHEEIYLSAIVRAIKASNIFEIGTFDGNTTRCLAESTPADAKVYTIDLPEEAFNATQSPDAFKGSQVGERYRNSPAAGKIHQLRADATTFDFSPYFGQMDFVFVDAAHDYPHGLADSRNALKLVRPGGVIVWHDFEPYWCGLVHAICEVCSGMPLRRLAGTSMAVLRQPN
jgi:hypothetical protein